MRKLIKPTGKIILDRCWYSKNMKINNYQLIKETKPVIIENKYIIYNCGTLIYKRISK